jgi:hypothetical protein
MHEIRVRLAVGNVKLEFRGRLAFFESRIEPLVRAAYARGLDVSRWAAGPGERRAAATKPSLPVFKPTAPAQFQRFATQVGGRASDADQRIMAFGFYLWNFERQNEFPEDQLEAFFRTVQEEPPADLPGRLADLRDRRRFLEPGEDARSWKLTPKGVNYVKNRLLGPA